MAKSIPKGKLVVSSMQEPSAKPANFEDILEAIGGFGRFQILILILLLILEIPCAFVTFIPIFVGKEPEFWECDGSILSSRDMCQCNGTLTSLTSDSDTIVTQWGLVCDSAWVSDFITSIQMFGMIFGNLYASQFVDWYGRKYGFLGTTLILALGSVVSAAAPNPYVYAAARFLCGVGISGFINTTSMAAMEFMPTSWRSVSSSVGPMGEGVMILSIIAYFVRPWRTLYWATTAPYLLIVIIYPFVPESPRWLLRNQRTSEADKVLRYIAKINNRSPISLDVLEEIGKRERVEAEAILGVKRFGYLDLIRDKTLRKTTLYLMAIWLSWSVTYYGISFNIKNVGGNIYLNVFFMGLANAVGQRAAILINNRLGRRKSLFVSMTFCALFLVALAVVHLVMHTEMYPALVVALSVIGLLGMSGARSPARLLAGESFPTAVRIMGLGLGGVAANFGGVLCPQLAFLGSRWPSIPFFIFAAVSVGGSLVSFLMNETTGEPLKDEISQDNEKSIRGNQNNSTVVPVYTLPRNSENTTDSEENCTPSSACTTHM